MIVTISQNTIAKLVMKTMTTNIYFKINYSINLFDVLNKDFGCLLLKS